MDKFRGLNSITEEQKQLFNKIPSKRKKAGIKAHINVYKKIQSYSNFSHLVNFLNMPHPCPKGVNFKVFFEVTLGQRIADCVILATSGETKNCYIVELKTCMSNTTSMSSPVRQVQRLQGTAQLSDSIKYIGSNAPNGTREYSLIPLLLFKTQKTFKTIFSECPQFHINKIFTSDKKLITFLSQRQDVSVSTLLRSHPTQISKRRTCRKKAWSQSINTDGMGSEQTKLSPCKQTRRRRGPKTKHQTPGRINLFTRIAKQTQFIANGVRQFN